MQAAESSPHLCNAVPNASTLPLQFRFLFLCLVVSIDICAWYHKVTVCFESDVPFCRGLDISAIMSTSGVTPSGSSQHTYRVLGVKKEWDTDKLKAFLEDLEPDIAADVESLAVEPDGRSQTATVSFQNNRVPSSPSLRRQKIVIEKDFHGITPLFTPPEADHRVE